MEVVYAEEAFPRTTRKTLFLAGPSPRGAEGLNWRERALEILKNLGYDGHVFVPLQRESSFPLEYESQVDWEQEGMRRADVVAFWVPRDLVSLPGFTTNVEFGEMVVSSPKKIVLGCPKDAPKCRFLDYLADRHFVDRADSLKETLHMAVEKIGDGALRQGGECEVPLYIWRVGHFQHWLGAQKAAGNRLDGFKLKMAFGVGTREGHLFCWVAHVNIWVAAEKRNKSNEIVISRPDIKHVVGLAPSLTSDKLDTRIVLVKEFRSPATTKDGFIREVPGGSGWKPLNPAEEATKEFREETGIAITSERLKPLAARQLAGTTTAHRAHAFYVQLTDAEIEEALRRAAEKTVAGNVKDSERTYVEVWTFRELLANPLTDWSNLGMIAAAIL